MPDLIKVKAVKSGNKVIHLLFLPDGTPIPGIVFTRVYDGMDDIPYVIAKFYIELEESK